MFARASLLMVTVGLLAAAAAPTNESADDATVAALRDQGPAALAQLLAKRDALMRRHYPPTAAELEAIDALVDRVAAQRYAADSRLFWYTDLEQAKAAAAASGKPILSLRMLGKLTDEFSCANSRFFRTTLYANREISLQLRERFVLHWQSVRPVPRVTIDFGDGRKLERTITGNSAHYVLASDGRPLDGLPGLYGPAKFLQWLHAMHELHARLASLDAADRDSQLQAYHKGRLRQVENDWARDLTALDPGDREPAMVVEPPMQAAAVNSSATPSFPTALKAARIAAPKRAVERPIVAQLAGEPAAIETATDEVWTRIAALPRHAVELDAASRHIIRRENPDAARAGALAVTKRKVEDPLLRLVGNLQTSIALDSVRNEYTLHRQIHQWFANGHSSGDVDGLNERVYAELFLTPSSDPWLGLAPTDAYTALVNGGHVKAAQ